MARSCRNCSRECCPGDGKPAVRQLLRELSKKRGPSGTRALAADPRPSRRGPEARPRPDHHPALRRWTGQVVRAAGGIGSARHAHILPILRLTSAVVTSLAASPCGNSNVDRPVVIGSNQGNNSSGMNRVRCEYECWSFLKRTSLPLYSRQRTPYPVLDTVNSLLVLM